MLLTVDIGNTNITIGVYKKDVLAFGVRLHTNKKKTADEYAIDLYAVSALNHWTPRDVDGAIISSVVPEITSTFARAVRLFAGVDAMILSPGFKSGLNIRIDNPAQLGADLVAGAVAAINMYRLPCVVMDLGTATKISVLDRDGTYCGCTICPGVNVSLEALSAAASQLPSISFEAPDCLPFGKNTITSMQAGVVLGTASMLDGLCERIEETLGEKLATIVATGGYSHGIVSHCRKVHVFEPNLILEGLRLLYEKNR